jgi:hypothetical protein
MMWSKADHAPLQGDFMRRMIVIASLAVAVLGASASAAEASKSCPSGSVFRKVGKGHGAGGVCIDLDTLKPVKWF